MTAISYIPAILLLEDGTFFEGHAAGKIGTCTGEICFNTGMTGYQELFTDPSYFGQIMVTTDAHIGNYGTLDSESESSSVKISGLVCKNFSTYYSRKMASESLQDFYIERNVVGISGIDTRYLVQYIRDKGAMNALISSEKYALTDLKQKLSEAPSMNGLELSSHVSTTSPYLAGDPSSALKIAVLDLGIKQSILTNFQNRGAWLKVFPAKTSYAEMEAWEPAGYFISNGPGDPSAMPYAVNTTREIMRSEKPLFGICLGHQLLALANGIPTYKMHNGHRGLNHPVKNVRRDTCEVTSQNHGFGIDAEATEKSPDVEVTHVNLNDQSIEGIRLKNGRCFSVQYHPEASPGPHDSHYLFDEFINMISL